MTSTAPDRQTIWLWTLLVILGVILAIVGWWRWATPAHAAATGGWRDPSGHAIHFVTVDQDVRLEVLDWGGSGRSLMLLAGSGNSAHVFDGLAPKLTDCCHVYAITRRGFGASSQPESGYDDQRLADDVLQVIERLAIDHPVLVGHSMAGGELTTLGHQHSDRLGGLVYLDALGDPRDWPASDPEWTALMKRLPPALPSAPCPHDMTSFSAYQATLQCSMKFTFPESELRATYDANPDGSVGRYKTPRRIFDAIGAGQKKRDYSNIRVPVLAMFEFPRSFDPPLTIGDPRIGPSDPQPRNEAELATVTAFARATKAFMDRWADNLKRSVPDARLVDLPAAGHYVFLTRERDVLREIHAFVARAAHAAR
jgi:pimeloyl-ACP methyl ester carboxylesterase